MFQEARLVTAIFGDPAGDDAAEMREVGIDVNRKAVERYPALYPDAQRPDFLLLRAVPDPDADAPPVRAPSCARESIIHCSSE